MTEILQKAKDKMKTFFSGVVTPEEIEALKQWVKFVNTAPAAELKEIKTSDGTSIFVAGVDTDGLVDVGLAAFSDAAGTIPMADGEYVLEDKSTITILSGKVSEVENAAAATEEELAAKKAVAEAAAKDANAKMSAQLSAQKTDIEKQSKEIADLKKQVVSLTNHLTKILSTPINTTIVAEKKFEDMSPLEQYRFNKHKNG